MADHSEETHKETLMEKITEKIHHIHDDSSSSSSDSDDEKPSLFSGKKKPVHHILGGGKPADVLLWRNKHVSASIVVGVTVIWVLFELLGYHLLSLVCHILMVSIALLFLYSNASAFLHKSPPKLPLVQLEEDAFVHTALALCYEVNKLFANLRELICERNLKKLLMMIAGLWVLSIIGSWCNFLTLFYIVFILLHTVPVVYEKHGDHIDCFADKAMVEVKRQYNVLDEKFLQKLPRVAIKDKKQQ